MGICPLTQRMCLYCSISCGSVICMDSDQIRKIKDLLVCPQTIMVLPKTDGKAVKQPNN